MRPRPAWSATKGSPSRARTPLLLQHRLPRSHWSRRSASRPMRRLGGVWAGAGAGSQTQCRVHSSSSSPFSLPLALLCTSSHGFALPYAKTSSPPSCISDCICICIFVFLYFLYLKMYISCALNLIDIAQKMILVISSPFGGRLNIYRNLVSFLVLREAPL